MPDLQIFNPNDQPSGKQRLLTELRDSLASDDYNSFFMAVAFVKVGPLIRLQKEIERWIAKGKSIEAIWGINHKGTSEQAVAFALNFFTRTQILFAGESLTFHPKMYLFTGPTKCRFFIGSHNLTVGGTETNWEAGVKIDLSLPTDQAIVNDTLAIWHSLTASALEITTTNFPQFVSSGVLLDESKTTGRRFAQNPATNVPVNIASLLGFPKLSPKAPSPLPVSAFAVKKLPTIPLPGTNPVVSAPTPTVKKKPPITPSAEALAIQIVVHHNGEFLLSVRALQQNPEFFRYPWTGQTIPKKPSNPSYPQMDPDPVVNLSVFDKAGKLVLQKSKLALNTVFYERKSEIRITVPPDVAQNTPDFSILLMKRAEDVEADYEYDIEIFAPGSPAFTSYLAACNQTLPSGGKPVARRMGWL